MIFLGISVNRWVITLQDMGTKYRVIVSWIRETATWGQGGAFSDEGETVQNSVFDVPQR